jgi:hypothetical protein
MYRVYQEKSNPTLACSQRSIFFILIKIRVLSYETYYYLKLFENGSPSAVKKTELTFKGPFMNTYIHCLEIQTLYLSTTILTKEN